MQQAIENEIRALFSESCHEMFLSLGCDISHCALVEDSVGGAPTAVIDAGSDEVELNIILRMPYSVLAMTYPVSEGDIQGVDDASLEDWLSELANLLMGRMKTKFLKHSVPIGIGLPTAYFGGEVDVFTIKEGYARFDFPFELDHELCECMLDVGVFVEDFQFSLDEDPDMQIANEGDIELL